SKARENMGVSKLEGELAEYGVTRLDKATLKSIYKTISNGGFVNQLAVLDKISLPNTPMADFIRDAASAYKAQPRPLDNNMLADFQELGVKHGLSEQLVGKVLFDNPNAFDLVRTTTKEMIAKSPARISEMGSDGNEVKVKYEINNLNQIPQERTVTVTPEGVKGALVDNLNALKADVKGYSEFQENISGMRNLIDEFRRDINVQKSESGENQPQEIKGADSISSGADLKQIPNEPQQTQAESRRISGTTGQFSGRFNDYLRKIQSPEGTLRQGRRFENTLSQNIGEGTGRQGTGDNRGSEQSYQRLRENYKEVIENPTKRNIQELDKATLQFQKSVALEKNIQLDSAAESFGKIQGNEKQISAIKEKYDQIASAEGRSSLNVDEIRSKHIEYERALNPSIEGTDTLLKTSLPPVQKALGPKAKEMLNALSEKLETSYQENGHKATNKMARELMNQLSLTLFMPAARPVTSFSEYAAQHPEAASMLKMFDGKMSRIAKSQQVDIVVDSPNPEGVVRIITEDGLRAKPRFILDKTGPEGRIPYIESSHGSFVKMGLIEVESVRGENYIKNMINDVDLVGHSKIAGEEGRVYNDPGFGFTTKFGQKLGRGINEIFGKEIVVHDSLNNYPKELPDKISWRAYTKEGSIVELRTKSEARQFFKERNIPAHPEWGWDAN
ncbi:MAG: hypothetical protein JW893_04890, partial [Candidatus Omnitrophica bacterium]|nr:hypothetical protein [Candidatus Omnitrophota bacterium]